MNENQQPPKFQAPSAPLVDNTASYAKRLAAALIDLFLVMLCVQPFVQQFKLEQFAENPFNAPPEILMKVLMYEVAVFFVINAVVLYQYGQTLGKRMLKIAIVDLANQKPKFIPLLFNRYVIQIAMIAIPFLNIIDVLIMLFRKDKRCLHDLIAKTKVIDLKINAASAASNSMGFLA